MDRRATFETITLDGRPAIAGERRDARSGQTIPSSDPATEAVLTTLAACDADDVDDAVREARRAFETGEWASDPSMRGVVLEELASLIASNGEELALLDSAEVGVPLAYTLADIDLIAATVRFTARAMDHLEDRVLASPAGALALNVHDPLGVVGVITPWNFPLFIAATKVTAALAAGNAVVLKPSELGGLSALRLADLATAAGLPAGILNVVTGTGATAGAALGRHPGVDMLSFTGSRTTAKQLQHLAGESNLKRLALECGGKSPQVVLASATDLPAIADAVAFGIFWNSGQVCTAGSRLIVHESVADELVSLVEDRARALVIGDPLDDAITFGPLVSHAQADRVLGYIERARAQGARLRIGGGQIERAGHFVEPTILDDVELEHEVFREEVFGPVLTVTRFRTADEAVTLANATDYALAASVWTADIGDAIGLARRIRAGTVGVNPYLDAPAPAPSGGAEPAGASGFGVEGGVPGIRAHQQLRSITINGTRH
jgi:acyl-CoA reductase-like NAD-dependent aldehyde dehydrogenase